MCEYNEVQNGASSADKVACRSKIKLICILIRHFIVSPTVKKGPVAPQNLLVGPRLTPNMSICILIRHFMLMSLTDTVSPKQFRQRHVDI